MKLLHFGIALILFIGCGKRDDSTSTGIEVGNPEVQALDIEMETFISIDYGRPSYDLLSKSKTLSKSLASKFTISKFNLGLKSVRYFVSYYENVDYNPEIGHELVSMDKPLEIDLVSGELPPILNRSELRSKGLKDLEFHFVPLGEEPEILGTWDNGKELVPVRIYIPPTRELHLRFHHRQMATSDSSKFRLDIRFFVQKFLGQEDLSAAVPNENGELEFSLRYNTVIHRMLLQQMSEAFNAMHWRMDDYNEWADAYSQEFLDPFLNLGQEQLRNTTFEDSLKNWIFHQQFGGKATYQTRGDTLVVDVAKAGNYLYSLQLIQEDLVLVAGNQYRMSFTMWSDQKGYFRIKNRLSMYHAPYWAYGSENTFVISNKPTVYQSLNSIFETDVFARIEFNIGARPGRLFITKPSVVLVK